MLAFGGAGLTSDCAGPVAILGVKRRLTFFMYILSLRRTSDYEIPLQTWPDPS